MSSRQQARIDGLNRGDVSAADSVFSAGCPVHLHGSPVPDPDVAGFKQVMTGLLAAFG